MTAITTLRNAIAKYPADSEVARLLSWAELTMGDLHDRIFELEEEVELLEADKVRRVLGSVVTSYVKMAFYTNCGERE